MALTIVAHITAKPDQVDLVRKELESLIPATRAETGCLEYELHLDNENPAHFMFYETWQSPEDWQSHMKSAHLQQVLKAVEPVLEEVKIYQMTKADH